MMRPVDIGSDEASLPDLDVLMERIRAELRAGASETVIADAGTVQTVSHPEHSDRQFMDRNPRRYRYSEFASLDNEVFVRDAYLAALGREPDQIGYHITLHRLEGRQCGRASLLLELLKSAEGQQRGATITGVAIRSSIEKLWYNRYARLVKVIGRLMWNSPRIANHVRQLASQAMAAERIAIKALAEAESARRLAQSSSVAPEVPESQVTEWVDRRMFERAAALERLITDARRELHAAKVEIDRKMTEHWRGIVDQKLRLDVLLAEVRRRMPEPLTHDQIGTLLSEEQQLLDALYVAFEDRHRGTRTDIKNRQRIYLKDIETAVLATNMAPILDVGCGRGEWLELLKENGFAACGCDINRIMVAEARDRGLDVKLGDALHALSEMPDAGLAAVTGFHFIEHLPFTAVVRLLDEALRVIRPGGVLILETPNPGNLLVASNRFYVDPTRRNPLPAEWVTFVAEARGFTRIETKFVTVLSSSQHDIYESALMNVLHERIYAAEEYAVIGWKA